MLICSFKHLRYGQILHLQRLGFIQRKPDIDIQVLVTTGNPIPGIRYLPLPPVMSGLSQVFEFLTGPGLVHIFDNKG